MAELSSNWKKLQAQLKLTKTASQPPHKRKFAEDTEELVTSKRRAGTRTSRGSVSVPTQKHSKARQMGGVHSSPQAYGMRNSQGPSLSLWADSNDISSEVIAEAYQLGLKDTAAFLSSEHDKINNGLTDGLSVGKYIAIDCEMVGVGEGGYESVLARLSVVDFHGRQIYDSYVRPQEPVTDWRTPISGMQPKHMRVARSFADVQQQAHQLLEGRVVVGHDVKHDLEVLKLSHPVRDIRDTAKYPAFKKLGNSRKPALRLLAQELLHIEIQKGQHSSVQDARVAMLLFRKHKSGFDVDHANRFTCPTMPNKKNPPQTKKKKQKKRRA